MSGPVTNADADPEVCRSGRPRAEIEVSESRDSEVGGFRVRRALPRRQRRTVGPWCFLDHMAPARVTEDPGLDVGPHPHMGLQTVTWLLEGELVHHDSLGSEQLISPGQLNLMTAGRGVSHSEEHTRGYAGDLHGVQLWIAQPSSTRNGAPAFEHHAELPRRDVDAAVVTVLVGDLDGVASPARRDSDHVGLDLELRPGGAVLPVRADFEHALVVFSGAVDVGGHPLTPGHLLYLGAGRDEVAVGAGQAARALLIGGVPLDETVLMWWNYVARTRAEIVEAHAAWMSAGDRFGHVDSRLARIEVDPPPWTR